jgi:hypothetical protein
LCLTRQELIEQLLLDNLELLVLIYDVETDTYTLLGLDVSELVELFCIVGHLEEKLSKEQYVKGC